MFYCDEPDSVARQIDLEMQHMSYTDLVDPGSSYSRTDEYRRKIHRSNIADALSRPTRKRQFVANMFPVGDVSILSAPGGVGKTFLLLQLAICVAAGRPFLGQAVEAGGVLGLFREDSEDEILSRADGLFVDLDISPTHAADRLRYECYNPGDADYYVMFRAGEEYTIGFKQLYILLQEANYRKVVLLDHIKLATDGENTSPTLASKAVKQLRFLAWRFDVAIIIVTHANREGKTSGTIEWENLVRAVYHLKIDHGSYILECGKSNYKAKLSSMELIRTEHHGFARRPDPVRAEPRGLPFVVNDDRCLIADEVFLYGLDNRKKELSPNKNSPNRNYAPSIFMKLPRAKRCDLTVVELAASMRRLLASGEICIIEGPTKSKAKILRRSKSVE